MKPFKYSRCIVMCFGSCIGLRLGHLSMAFSRGRCWFPEKEFRMHKWRGSQSNASCCLQWALSFYGASLWWLMAGKILLVVFSSVERFYSDPLWWSTVIVAVHSVVLRRHFLHQNLQVRPKSCSVTLVTLYFEKWSFEQEQFFGSFFL